MKNLLPLRNTLGFCTHPSSVQGTGLDRGLEDGRVSVTRVPCRSFLVVPYSVPFALPKPLFAGRHTLTLCKLKFWGN